MSDKQWIDEGIEKIAAFEGWQLVSIGYCGRRDGRDDDETEWQIANKGWLEKMGINSVGKYFVNIKEDKFIEQFNEHEEDNLNYYTNWNHMMRVVQHISKIQRGRFGFTIDPWSIDIFDYRQNPEKRIVQVHVDKDEPLNETYFHAVVAFIDWFNAQLKKNESQTKAV